MGVTLLELGGSSPPESHKGCRQATTSSLHCMEAGYSSLCTRTPLPLKINPPAVGQPFLHPNPLENEQRVAGRDLEFHSHHLPDEEIKVWGGMSGTERSWSGTPRSRRMKG